MTKPIKVGLVRCDTHGAYFAAAMGAHDPLKIRNPVPIGSDPPHSWMNGSVHFYFHDFCADPRQVTVETVDGFEIVKVWDDQREVAECLSGCLHSRPKVCDSLDEASDDVDLVFIGECNGDGSDHLALARPGLEKGVPTFIDKPLANTVEDVDAILSLADKNGAPLFSASMLRHIPGAFQFRSRLAEIGGADSGFIRGGGCHIAGQVHSVSLAQSVFGNGIRKVRAMGPGDLGVVHLSWDGRENRPRNGVVLHHNVSKSWHCSMYVSAYGPDGAILNQNNIDDWHYPYAAANILKLVKQMVHTGEAHESLADMVEAVAIVNAGRLSLKQNSREVDIDEIRHSSLCHVT